MVRKYKEKYRIDTARLFGYDYSLDGIYFVTFCTYNRIHYFGKVVKGKMKLSKIGIMADKYWQEIPGHFPSTILDEYIIMPNHVHGIIIFDSDSKTVEPRHGVAGKTAGCQTRHAVANENIINKQKNTDEPSTQNRAVLDKFFSHEPGHALALRCHTHFQNKFGPLKPNSLPVIIGAYKASVSRWCNKNNQDFKWQTRYYDHIIRNEKSLNNIRQYIRNNPNNWHRDRNNPPGLEM